MNSYTMDENQKYSKQASKEIGDWLRSFDSITHVRNVEMDRRYQDKDIDILCKTENDSLFSVEIKADTYHNTGNFFFETVSNTNLDKPGCFMYTEADYLFYYFVTPKLLYILPMPQVRKWFLKYKDEFKVAHTSTVINNNKYYSKGRLVPIKRVLKEIDNVRKYKL